MSSVTELTKPKTTQPTTTPQIDQAADPDLPGALRRESRLRSSRCAGVLLGHGSPSVVRVRTLAAGSSDPTTGTDRRSAPGMPGSSPIGPGFREKRGRATSRGRATRPGRGARRRSWCPSRGRGRPRSRRAAGRRACPRRPAYRDVEVRGIVRLAHAPREQAVAGDQVRLARPGRRRAARWSRACGRRGGWPPASRCPPRSGRRRAGAGRSGTGIPGASRAWAAVGAPVRSTTSASACQWSGCRWVVTMREMPVRPDEVHDAVGLGGGVHEDLGAGLLAAQQVAVVVVRTDRELADQQVAELVDVCRSTDRHPAVIHSGLRSWTAAPSH